MEKDRTSRPLDRETIAPKIGQRCPSGDSTAKKATMIGWRPSTSRLNAAWEARAAHIGRNVTEETDVVRAVAHNASATGAHAMQMQQIRYFMALCQERSFTRAARRNGVAQPSVTNAIKALEAELGGPLFVRTTPVSLTRLGHIVRPYLARIARDAEHACRAARAITGSVPLAANGHRHLPIRARATPANRSVPGHRFAEGRGQRPSST